LSSFHLLHLYLLPIEPTVILDLPGFLSFHSLDINALRPRALAQIPALFAGLVANFQPIQESVAMDLTGLSSILGPDFSPAGDAVIMKLPSGCARLVPHLSTARNRFWWM
jgi:hypothetical protein